MTKKYISTCPACGGKATLTTCSDNEGTRQFFLACDAEGSDGIISGCGAGTKFYLTEQEAINEWALVGRVQRKCKDCGKDFVLDDGEVNFYIRKKLHLPVRCKSCRLSVKQKRLLESQAKTPEKYCEADCKNLGKKFQGYGGWLGMEVPACRLTGELLQSEGTKTIRCNGCTNKAS